MKTTRLRFRFAFSLCLIGALAGARAWAAPVGEVTHMSGAMVARQPDGKSKILGPKSKVESGDLLATANATYARVKFIDGSEITLRPNSQFMIEKFTYDKATPQEDSAVLRLLKGGLRTITGVVGKRKVGSYQFNTVVATIGIRGTEFGVLFCASDCADVRDNSGNVPKDGLHLDVNEGVIDVTNTAGVGPLAAGEFGFVGNRLTGMIRVPKSQGASENIPGFGGSQECVVQ